MSDRFRSLEGILSSPPKRPSLRAVDDDKDDDSDGLDLVPDGENSVATPEAQSRALDNGSETEASSSVLPPSTDDSSADHPSAAAAPHSVAGEPRSTATTTRRHPNPRGTGRTPRPGTVGAAALDVDSQSGEAPAGVGEESPAGPVSQTTGGTRRVAFRLASDLHERLADRVRAEGTSQAHVVLDAVEAAHGSGTLGDLVAAERPVVTSGSLFARRPTRGAAVATIPTEIRLDAGSLHVLDQLVAEAGADSRTQLILAALKQHLG